MKKSIKILSVFLAVLTFFSILSAATPVFAAEVNEYIADKEYTEKLLTEVVENNTEEKAPIVKEIEEKRDENKKVYLREDGTYTAVISKTPVHYEKDGEWVDIVNDLKTDGDVLTNTAGNFNVEFPKEISEDNEIKVENGKETITFSIVETEKSNGKVKNNKKQKQDKSKVSDEEIFNNDISRTVSEIEYEDVLENTNLEYFVTPNGVKENIIVENKESLKKSYSFNITKGKLKAELDKENNLYFKNSKGEVVFTIPAPVMTDSNGAISYDIDVKVKNLKEETITLTYTPDKKWLNDKDRAYPVAIDPVIMLNSGENDSIIEDTVIGYSAENSNVAATNGADDFIGAVSDMSDLKYNILVRFTSDLLNVYKQPNIVVTDAKYMTTGVVSNGNIIAKPINYLAGTGNTTWNSKTITWNTAFATSNPTIAYENKVIDYYTGVAGSSSGVNHIYFDVTNILNEWINGTRANHGFALVADSENLSSMLYLGGSTSSKNYYSYCTIDFVDANGYNSNFEYLTQDVGKAGTFNVNTFTRGLSGYREDLTLSGNRMPVSLGFNYNSSFSSFYKYYQDFMTLNGADVTASYPYGENWTPNYLRCLTTLDETQYYYFTETGSMAVFNATEDEAGNTVFEEDISGESGYELEVVGSGTNNRLVITNLTGEKEYFDSYGRLVEIHEAEANSDGIIDKITISYESSTEEDFCIPKIKCITDGVGRTYNFTYSNNKLINIICKDSTGTVIEAGTTSADFMTTYTYLGNNLVTVNYPTENSTTDPMQVAYTYDGSGNLKKAQHISGYNIQYTYDISNKITNIAEYADESQNIIGNYITLLQNSDNCVVVNDAYYGSNTYLFSKTGELLYTYDDKGNYCKNTSLDFSVDEDETEPTIIEDSSWKIISENLLKNSSFETQYPTNTTRALNWNNNFTRTSAVTHSGSYAYLVNSTSDITRYNQQSINVSGNENYTFSAYVKAATVGALTLKIEQLDASSTIIKTNKYRITNTNDWERFSLTVETLEGVVSLYVSFGFENSQGCYYVDSVQLERGLGTAVYNFIENNSFNNNLEYWSSQNDTSLSLVDEVINGESVKALKLPTCMPYFNVGSDSNSLNNKVSSVTQNIKLNGKKDEVYSIGAWFKGEFTDGLLSETTKNNLGINYTPTLTRFAQLKATYTYTDSTGATLTENFAVDFIRGINGWQYVNGCFVLKGETTSINVTIITQNIPVDCYVTNVELYKEETAITFSNETTDAEVQEPENYDAANEGECNCEECEDLDCTCRCEDTTTCTCLPCTRYSNKEIKSTDGKTVTTQMYNGSQYMQHSSTYSDDLNSVISETDENNISTDYLYEDTGEISLVTDANNITTTYKSNAMGYLYSAETPVSNLSDANKTKISLLFNYNGDLLSEVTADDVVYTYTYDSWGQIDKVKVDNQELVDYNYGINENRSRITNIKSTIDSSNDYTLNYIYDLYGNIVQVVKKTETNGNADEISYYYHYDNLGTLLYIDDSNTGRTIRYCADGGVTIEETGTNDVIYELYYNENNETVETIDGGTYTAKSYDDSYSASTGDTTQKEAVVSTKNSTTKTLGVTTVTDWFGRNKTVTVSTNDPTTVTTTSDVSIVSGNIYKGYDSTKTTNLISTNRNTISYNGVNRAINIAYTYDENGRIISRRNVGSLATDLVEYNTYAYDEAGQLVREDKNTEYTWLYEYDANGNITKRKTYNYTAKNSTPTTLVSTDTFTYATGTWEDRLVSYNGQSISYDSIGNPTKYLGADLIWRGRELESYSKGSNAYYYSYDVDGMRYQKVVYDINTDADELTEKSRYNYVYSDGQLILLSYTTNGTTQNAKFIYDSAGEVRGFVVNGTTQYLYVKNPQGDIVAIINESGVPVVRYIYDAWGNTTISADSGYENLVNLSPFAYRGYCYDNDIKMYYLQSRYYDPKICRFINADSSEYLGATGTVLSCNLFAYCENDPVNYNDETGCAKNHGKYHYFFVYSRKGSDFKRQAKWMANYAYKNKKVKFIYIEKVTDFIKEWNKLPSKRIIDVHLFLHGYRGSLCFKDGELIYDKALKSKNNHYFSELKKINPTGKVYLYSCNGGTNYSSNPKKTNSVAQQLAKKVDTHVVRAAVDDSVNYFRWYAPTSCLPILAYNTGYWADFSYYKGELSIENIGKEWYL